MAADDPTAAKAEENRHQHPLMYLHANKTATANNTTHVKREEPQSTAARENDKDEVKIMNAINKSSSSSSSKMSSIMSMKSIIMIVILIVVIISLHSTLQAFEIIDNKIATSAILLHHCHSFIVTVATILSKIFYAFKDIILLLIASSSSSPPNNSSNNAQVMVMEQFQSRLQKGQQLMAQYKDISGSEMVCKSVANAVVITANDRKRNIDKRGNGDDDDGDEAQD
eukprot:scaffold6336_cov138-Skeletonema_marinoi.AAC.3